MVNGLTQRYASRMAVADRGNAGAVQIGAMPGAFKVRDHQRRDCCGSSAQGKRQFVLKRHLMHLVCVVCAAHEVHQMSFKHKLALALGAGTTTIATLVITYFEGDRHRAYLDGPGVPTICYGHTRGVALGQTVDHSACERLLRQDLTEALAAVDRRVSVPLPEPRRAALASFVHNFGETKFARSTLLRRINAGEGARACSELSRWIYGKDNASHGRKRMQPGLVKRRRIERQLCEMPS